MKKKLLFFLLMLSILSVASAEGAGTINVHLEKAGTLSIKLEELGVNVKTVTDLAITGTLNQEDFRVMSKIMTALMYVDISATDIKEIPSYAFDGKSTLQKCIVPEGIQTIGIQSFSNCSELVNLPFGQAITNIGSSAFGGCYKMRGDIIFPKTLNQIGRYAFHNCYLLTSVDMSLCETMYQIEDEIFYNCPSLLKIVLPNNSYFIGQSAFSRAAITEITIPASVTGIGRNAFSYSYYQLKTINMLGGTPPGIEESTFSDKSTSTLNVPTGSLKAYSYAPNWSAFSNIEEFGIQVEVDENGTIIQDGETIKNGKIVFHNAKETSFTLVPNSGYTVNKVTFNKQDILVEGNTIKIEAGIKSGILNISFILKKFNLNVTTEGNGKLKYNEEPLSTQQTLLVDSASSAKFTLVPEAGYAVKSILYNKVEGVAQQNESIYATPFAEGNANLVVIFAAKGEIEEVQKMKITIGAHGNVVYKNTPLLQESDIMIKKGAIAAFAITPDKYYMIGKVIYNQMDVTQQVSETGIFTTESVDADATLEITFKLNPTVTINIEEPETLKNLLTEEQLGIITYLTLTGKIGYSDFITMRDNMTLLSILDMSQAIVSLGGAWGGSYHIPINAFCTGYDESAIGKKTLTEVRLPINTVTIGGYAFANCTNLKKINFEDCTKLYNISDYAFRGTGLTSVDLSQTKITSLTNALFNECIFLSEVQFPITLESLGDAFRGTSIRSLDLSICTKLKQIANYAFRGHQYLEEVKFPSNIEIIESGVFSHCELKKLDLSVCTALTQINEKAFYYNQSLKSVKFPASLTTIANNAFAYCGISGTLELPASLTSMGDGVFYNCTLKKIDLSACTALTQINENAFSYNQSLKSVKFPASLTTIAKNAFSQCGISGTLELPASLTSIGDGAFGGNIIICKVAAIIPPTLGKYVFDSSLAAVFVPENSVKAYKNAAGWKEYTILGGENRIEVNVTKPGNLAIDIMEQAEISPALVTHLTVHGALNSKDFGVMRSNMTVLYSLDLSNADAEVIPLEAFRDKKILMEFKAPKNLSLIEAQAFSGCTALSGILELPDGVTTIGSSAFSNCTSLAGIKFSKNLLRIGNDAFNGCTNLIQEIIFPEKLRTIESNAFSDCNSLFGTMTLPESLESLGYSVFQKCSNLQKVEMSACSSLTEIPEKTFYSCSNLEQVSFPEKLRYIRENAFVYCSKLDNLKFPATLYTIDNAAFGSCESLIAIDLSSCNHLNSISNYAFSYCTSLEIINLPASLTSIGAYAFSECRALANISIANTVPAHLGDYVFQRVNTEVCILSIPTNSYYDYLTAEQWGAFVQMRKAIAVSIDNAGGSMEYVNNANVEEEEKGAAPKTVYSSKAKTTAATKGAIATNGSSIYVKKNETVSFFISPKGEYEIKEVIYNDKDVTTEVINGVFTTPKVSDKANLKVSFTNDPTGMASPDAKEENNSTLRVYTTNHSVMVCGVEEGVFISVYSISGILISKKVSIGTDTTFDLPTGCMYIIRTDHAQTIKVAL